MTNIKVPKLHYYRFYNKNQNLIKQPDLQFNSISGKGKDLTISKRDPIYFKEPIDEKKASSCLLHKGIELF